MRRLAHTWASNSRCEEAVEKRSAHIPSTTYGPSEGVRARPLHPPTTLAYAHCRSTYERMYARWSGPHVRHHALGIVGGGVQAEALAQLGPVRCGGRDRL